MSVNFRLSWLKCDTLFYYTNTNASALKEHNLRGIREKVSRETSFVIFVTICSIQNLRKHSPNKKIINFGYITFETLYFTLCLVGDGKFGISK